MKIVYKSMGDFIYDLTAKIETRKYTFLIFYTYSWTHKLTRTYILSQKLCIQ